MHGRHQELHAELRPAAPGGARRAAPRARARRRGDPARRPAHRPAAPRHREARRDPHLHPVAALHGPARLRLDDVQRARLLPGDREAARRRRADPRPVHPRDVLRDHAPDEPPDVARRARPRLRRDEHLHLLLPRARGPVRHVRGGLGRAHARGLLPPGRRLPRPAGHDAAVPRVEDPQRQGDRRAATRTGRGRCSTSSTTSCKRFPEKVDEYETLLTDNRIWKQRTVGIGVVTPERALEPRLHRADAARLRHRSGTCASTSPTTSTTRWTSTCRSASTATPTTATWCASRRCARPTASSASASTGCGQSGPGHHRQPQGGAAVAGRHEDRAWKT